MTWFLVGLAVVLALSAIVLAWYALRSRERSAPISEARKVVEMEKSWRAWDTRIAEVERRVAELRRERDAVGSRLDDTEVQVKREPFNDIADYFERGKK